MHTFIVENLEVILSEWENFARSFPAGKNLSINDLRNDAENILRTIAHDMQVHESEEEQSAKSRGLGKENLTAQKFGNLHALARYKEGFDINEVVAEYRALRASVVSLWIRKMKSADSDTLYQLMRFNEALDEALTYTIQEYVKKASQQQTELANELKEASIQKTEFLATLTHEFKILLTPLTKTLSDIKKSMGHNKLVSSAFAVMERQLTLLTYLVDDLANVGNKNEKKLDLKPESVILQSVIEEAISTCSALPKWKSQTLEVNIPSRPIYVEGDPFRLLQVFNNLLNNASRYTPPDGKIKIVMEREYNDVVINVSDTGIGIAPDRVQTLFESRWTTEDSSIPSSGVGLNLVKSLVERHKGTITAQSKGTGKGSKIIVRLPQSVKH